MAPPIGKTQIKLNAILYAEMVSELIAGPCTAQELADHTGMHMHTVLGALRALHRRELIRVGGWEKDAQGRCVIRVFAWGPGKDARRPAPRDRNEKRREAAARERQRKALMATAVVPFAGLMASNDSRKAA